KYLALDSETTDLNKKRNCQAAFPEIEEAVVIWFSSQYRKSLVKNRVDAYDDTINNNKSSVDPTNILDAINFCGEARDTVSQSTIVNCWKKTKILPDYDLNTIHELQEEINNDEIIREEIDELQEEINKLYFSKPISAMEFVNIDNEVSEEFSDAEIIETVHPSQNNEVAGDEDEGIEPEPSIPVK
ncbi:9193_t:CDS:2, partial [Entrophospora sp. SA101]